MSIGGCGHIAQAEDRAVQFTDALHQCHAEAAAFGADVAAAIEALGQLIQFVGRHAGTAVANRNEGFALFLPSAYGDLAAFRGVAQCVFDQVAQGHAQQLRIADDAEGIRRQRTGKLVAAADGFGRQRGDGIAAQACQIEFLSPDGFRFVGSTIIYAHMQAMGLVNDHTTDCFRYAELTRAHGTTTTRHVADDELPVLLAETFGLTAEACKTPAHSGRFASARATVSARRFSGPCRRKTTGASGVPDNPLSRPPRSATRRAG